MLKNFIIKHEGEATADDCHPLALAVIRYTHLLETLTNGHLEKTHSIKRRVVHDE